jgi:hypothetical protein
VAVLCVLLRAYQIKRLCVYFTRRASILAFALKALTVHLGTRSVHVAIFNKTFRPMGLVSASDARLLFTPTHSPTSSGSECKHPEGVNDETATFTLVFLSLLVTCLIMDQMINRYKISSLPSAGATMLLGIVSALFMLLKVLHPVLSMQHTQTAALSLYPLGG